MKSKSTIRSAVLDATLPYRVAPVKFLQFASALPKVRYSPIGNTRLETAGDFFAFQHETSIIIDQIKDNAINYYFERIGSTFSELKPELLHIHANRRSKVRHRGVFSRICNLALEGSEEPHIANLAASVEFLLEHMYYLNQVFDNKSKPNLYRNHIASSISLGLGKELLRENDERTSAALTRIWEDILSAFDRGEYYDCTQNIWHNLEQCSLEERIRCCNDRTYYINAFFYQAIPKLIETVMSVGQDKKVDPSRFQALSDYAHNFGMGLQVVNDISDFVPAERNSGTSEKVPDDAYNDIKNGKMTYPIIAMLHMANTSDRSVIISCFEQGFSVSDKDLKESTDIFLRSGAYNECRALARKYADRAKKVSDCFAETPKFLLKRMAIILDSNRYYRALVSLNSDPVCPRS